MSLSDAICCCISILVGILLVTALVRSRKKKAADQEEQPAVQKVSSKEYLNKGAQDLRMGNRTAAVNAFLYVYRHGRPDLREQAIRALEGMGEVETF